MALIFLRGNPINILAVEAAVVFDFFAPNSALFGQKKRFHSNHIAKTLGVVTAKKRRQFLVAIQPVQESASAVFSEFAESADS